MAKKRKFSLKRRLQHMTKRQKVRFTINCVLISLCVICLGVFIYAYPRINEVKKAIGNIQTETVGDPERVIVDDDGYWSILLMGLDSRDADGVNDMSTSNYGDKRSDCMILISIDRKTKDIKLVSVYRDTVLQMRDLDYFESGDYCFSKATHAYSWGSASKLPNNDTVDAGPYYTMDMLEKNLDLQIDNFVTVNFGVVADVINALGGVTLEVDEAEVACINPYIQEINKITGSKSANIYTAGVQTLDGTQATAYGRIRYTAGDDYKRTERQREVLMLTAQNAKNASIDELIDVLGLVAPSVRTDLTMDDMNELITKYALSFNLDMENGSRGFPFEKATKSGDSYVYPIDLDTNVIALHEYLYGIKDYQVSEKVQEISDEIASMYYYGGGSYGGGYSNNNEDSGTQWYAPDDETPIVVTEAPVEYEPEPTEEPVAEDPEVPEYTETQAPVATEYVPVATGVPVQSTEVPVVTEVPVQPTEYVPVVTEAPVVTNPPDTGNQSTDIEIPLDEISE